MNARSKPTHQLSTSIMLTGMILWLCFGMIGNPIAHAQQVEQTISSDTNFPVELNDLGLESELEGWILIGRQLYWTRDAGASWSEITPPIPFDAHLQDVEFLDTETGRVLWTKIETGGEVIFQIASTADQGNTWSITNVQTLAPDDPDANVANARMTWIDENTGWISVKRNSGSNFSLGTLFRTTDGGLTWERYSPPLGEAVYFINSLTGWMAGGPAGNQLFKTQDGGATWEELSIFDGIDEHPGFRLYSPIFQTPENGWIPVVTLEENDLQVEFYATSDGGQNWRLVGSHPVGSLVGEITLSAVDDRELVIIVPNSDQIIQMAAGVITTIRNQDGNSAALVGLDMFSLNLGWAKWNEGNCETQEPVDPGGLTEVTCTATSQLMKTSDGGLSWETIHLPGSGLDTLRQESISSFTDLSQAGAGSTGNTATLIGQGFDLCEIATLPQLQAWWDGSPYKAVNLYIGGSRRACSNIALTAAYLRQMRLQGWSFIPTWVGPQAPCWYSGGISYDVETAYAQGVAEANLAVERLAALGLTYADKTGSVVYYDMEHYGTEISCRNAVNAFMNGWVSQLHARGNTAGVYGSTLCNTGLSDFQYITNVPDVIWPARWYHNSPYGYYDPLASVWTLGSCIPTSSWANHQRIRQYEGGHNETWGGVVLNIDNDVLDGVVAFPMTTVVVDPPYVASIVTKNTNPTKAASVGFTVTFSEAVTGVSMSDFSLTTSGVSGASITGVSGSGSSYTVSVNTGTGNGTIRLDVRISATFADVDGYGPNSLPYTSGEIYIVDKGTIIYIPLFFHP